MNGSIMSAVLLARAVRGCLRGLPTDAIAGDAIVAPYAHSIRFVEVDDWRGPRPTVLAPDVTAWIGQVVAAGATDAWLRHGRDERAEIPGRVQAAFANGGGLWSVVVSGPRGAEGWIVQARFAPEGDPDPRTWWQRWSPFGPARVHRPWELFFVRVPMDPQGIAGPVPDLTHCTRRLRLALEGNRDFATRWRLKPWAQYFDAALAALGGESAPDSDLPDFAIPDVFGASANRLLAAAARSWCFGGMGTWNDIIVDDDAEQERQEALASELYEALVEAIEQATWPSVTGSAGR